MDAAIGGHFSVCSKGVLCAFLVLERCSRSVLRALQLTGGGWKAAEGGQSVSLLNVSYDPTRELYEAINDAFAADYLKKAGTKVAIEQSHGGSGRQAASVVNGLQADVVTLGVAWDIDAIQKAGLVKPGWQDKFRYNSAPYTSTVAFLVRKGNPKHIHDWKDLLRPGVQIIAPNPKVSGAGRWAFLGLWGATAGAKTYDLSTRKASRPRSPTPRRRRIFRSTRTPRLWQRLPSSTSMSRFSTPARAARRSLSPRRASATCS